jgi:hypothetical protein
MRVPGVVGRLLPASRAVAAHRSDSTRVRCNANEGLGIAFLTACLFACVSSPASAQGEAQEKAQERSPSENADTLAPRTGDAWVDEWLEDMNLHGARYPDAFIDEVARYRAAPRAFVLELLAERGWQPGDIYFACALAQVVARPCAAVVGEWTRDHAEGWGAVAKRLGVEPDSDAFARIKRGIVPSYDRWARPIELDAELRRAFPKRGKGVPLPKPASEGDAAK